MRLMSIKPIYLNNTTGIFSQLFFFFFAAAGNPISRDQFLLLEFVLFSTIHEVGQSQIEGDFFLKTLGGETDSTDIAGEHFDVPARNTFQLLFISTAPMPRIVQTSRPLIFTLFMLQLSHAWSPFLSPTWHQPFALYSERAFLFGIKSSIVFF